MVGSAARNLFVDIDIDPSSCQSDSMDLFGMEDWAKAIILIEGELQANWRALCSVGV